MEKLPDCPFCGGKPELSGFNPGNGRYFIRCIECQVQMTEDRRDKVISKWNRREQRLTEKDLKDFGLWLVRYMAGDHSVNPHPTMNKMYKYYLNAKEK